MPIIERVSAIGSQGQPIVVHPVLLRELRAAGIAAPAADGKLSAQQVEQLLAGKSLEQRFSIKHQLAAHGLLPA